MTLPVHLLEEGEPMPLRDHFHPPLTPSRSRRGFHGNWASSITYQLNSELLPPDYYASSFVQIDGGIEVDVGTFHDGADGGRGGVATWSPPKPSTKVALEAIEQDRYEVLVHQDLDGPLLRAAIELVSEANKDRPASRRAFVTKCVGYLQRGACVIVIDLVTNRLADLNAEIHAAALGHPRPASPPAPAPRSASPPLFAASYRIAGPRAAIELEAWSYPLRIGAELPTVPLWLDTNLSVPLALEESYQVTSRGLRMPPEAV